MDVGFYLGELLMQQGEVSVPGLGYFVRARVSGYYDENEGKFYPPYHQAQFDIQSIDNDAFAEYIANKKNISIASAKYFSEKYITGLKQDALIGEVPIGNLGWFYTESSLLTFKPAQKIIDDALFYGFEPVKIKKTGHSKPEEAPNAELVFPPKLITPEIQPEETQLEPIQTLLQEEEAGISPEFFDADEEEEKSNNGVRVSLITLAVILLLGTGAFALYKYEPDTFYKLAFWKSNAVMIAPVKPKGAARAVDSAKTDSVKTDTASAKIAKDTLAKTALTTKKIVTTVPKTVVPAPKATVTTENTPTQKAATQQPKTNVIIQKPAVVTTNPGTFQKAIVKPEKTGAINAKPSDAVGTRRYEVYAFTGSNIAEVNAAIKKIKKAGLDPRLVTDAPDTLYHISIGHFATKQEATDCAVKAIEGSKVPGGYAYGIEIIPSK
ncbi:SPOR domain-containing protein [Mucilaginibacter sp.]|uniref:HU domain-containing protein n=1 Tax=Mucilaginibacter sp. TaxID=1882438 RepID=UPI00262CE57A|nr:SPOR domain-containing protein [Mucilaginibacter sp.]MDB5030347.1 hypothetical protein [Mucilaginibacter sp.]